MDKKTMMIIGGLGVVAAAALGSTVTLLATRGNSSTTGSPAAVGNTTPATGATDAQLSNNVASEGQSTGVFINEKEISKEQVDGLKQMYGAAPPPGRYWYDPRSGLYGYWGREAAGYIRPGHDFGPLSPRASDGNTGIFLNGREINLTGIEGDPTPRANLVAAMQRAQGSNSNGYRWRDGSGATITSEGNCTFAAIPGAPVYSTPDCG